MEIKLRKKLHEYIVGHHPELLLRLQENFSLTTYINDKVLLAMPQVTARIEAGWQTHEIEAVALKEMTSELGPSRFLYLKEVLEEDFPEEYGRFREAGVLTYELVNMIEVCADVFKTFGFLEAAEDNRLMRYAIIAHIHDYLN